MTQNLPGLVQRYPNKNPLSTWKPSPFTRNSLRC